MTDREQELAEQAMARLPANWSLGDKIAHIQMRYEVYRKLRRMGDFVPKSAPEPTAKSILRVRYEQIAKMEAELPELREAYVLLELNRKQET